MSAVFVAFFGGPAHGEFRWVEHPTRDSVGGPASITLHGATWDHNLPGRPQRHGVVLYERDPDLDDGGTLAYLYAGTTWTPAPAERH